ncbi:hypothetical protein [Streptomyces sp. SID1034]|uniref:hypothetical protein n=1 Tax=Streptomyces TaxID=1883 RepID=UPI001369BAF5|nr:hypothetical protein [Streptomyces sp. SID1034]MYV95301.1 hypothetical protein [Streptomyces sp. SID1034]
MHEDTELDGSEALSDAEDIEEALEPGGPVVLVVADRSDPGVGEVVRAIEQNDDVRVHRFDPSAIGDGKALVVGQIVGKLARFWVGNDHGRTYLDEIRAVWWRPSARTSEGWRTLEALLATCSNVFWIGSPSRVHALSSPPRNLIAAASAGLHTPLVEIHDHPGAALMELSSRWGVVRTLSWDGYPFGTGGGLDDVLASPAVVFQQGVRHATYLVSAVYVDGQLFAARTELPDSPLRFESEPARAPRPTEAFFDIPEPVRASVTRFCETFMGGTFTRLRYALLHFLVDDHDKWWFDKIEPCGDFWPVEEATKQPVSQAVATLLATAKEWE